MNRRGCAFAFVALVACGGATAQLTSPQGDTSAALYLVPTGDPSLDAAAQTALIQRGYTLVEATSPADARLEIKRASRGTDTEYFVVALAHDGHVLSVGEARGSANASADDLARAVAQLEIPRGDRSRYGVSGTNLSSEESPVVDAAARSSQSDTNDAGTETAKSEDAVHAACRTRLMADAGAPDDEPYQYYQACLLAAHATRDPAKTCAPNLEAALMRCARREEARIAEEQRRAALTAQRAEEARKHVAACKSTWPARLAQAKTDASRIPAERSRIINKCAALRPNCTIVQLPEHAQAVCHATSADDLAFYDHWCTLPQQIVFPQTVAIDQSGTCADVDSPVLVLSLSAGASEIAQLQALRAEAVRDAGAP